MKTAIVLLLSAASCAAGTVQFQDGRPVAFVGIGDPPITVGLHYGEPWKQRFRNHFPVCWEEDESCGIWLRDLIAESWPPIGVEPNRILIATHGKITPDILGWTVYQEDGQIVTESIWDNGIDIAGDDQNSAWADAMPYTPGDVTTDGQTNVFDLNTLALHWQQSGTWIDGDVTLDGFVDSADLNVIALNWHPLGRAPVPESSGWLLAFAACALALAILTVRRPSALR